MTTEGPRGLEYKCSNINESAEATISEYRHVLYKFCLKKASTKVAMIEKARPPAWDLLTTPRSRTPCRNNIGILWLLDSTTWLHHPRRMEGGGKRGAKQPWVLIQSTRKQGSTLHMHGYLCKGAISVDWITECQNKRGIASPVKDYTSGSLHLAACRSE